MMKDREWMYRYKKIEENIERKKNEEIKERLGEIEKSEIKV